MLAPPHPNHWEVAASPGCGCGLRGSPHLPIPAGERELAAAPQSAECRYALGPAARRLSPSPAASSRGGTAAKRGLAARAARRQSPAMNTPLALAALAFLA